MRYFIATIATLFLPLGAAMADDQVPQVVAIDVAGVWLSESQTSKIVIEDCGDGTPCGVIAWIKPGTSDATTDGMNPDETLRTRPLIGLKLLEGFERRKTQWKKGTIYDPETGKTYASKIKLLADGNMQLKGCIGPFCKTQIWTPSVLLD